MNIVALQLKQKIALIIASLLLVLGVGGLGVFVAPSYVSAQEIQNKICAGSNFNLDGNGGDCKPCGDGGTDCKCDKNGENCQQKSVNKINNIITDVVNILSTVVGVLAVIMIIWGGLKYITSGGDSGRISSAKNTILYALIGLVIVALAQVIVRFVLTKIV